MSVVCSTGSFMVCLPYSQQPDVNPTPAVRHAHLLYGPCHAVAGPKTHKTHSHTGAHVEGHQQHAAVFAERGALVYEG